MAESNVKLTVTADNNTIGALQRLIAQRIQYTNESAKEALAACAIQILISLRAATSVAKAEKPDMSCKSEIYPSFLTNGKTKIPCLRLTGSHARYPINNRLVIWATNNASFNVCWVYAFTDKRGDKEVQRLVVAPDIKTAAKAAQTFIKKRVQRHKGLAKVALGKLMNKASETSKVNTDKANEDTSKIADEMSRAIALGVGSGSSGSYSLTCEDNLDYAMLALQGQQSTFELALQKASNKIASVIKQKIGDNFFAPQIDTPFSELRNKK